MTSEQNEQIMQVIKELHGQMTDGFTNIDQRFEAVNERFEQMDERFEAVEQKLEQHDRQFEAMEKRFDGVDEGINKLQPTVEVFGQKNLDNETQIHRIKKEMGQQ